MFCLQKSYFKNLSGSYFFVVLISFFIVVLVGERLEAKMIYGPAVRGVGGAGRASSIPLEGVLLNPSLLPRFHDYYLGSFWSEGSLSKKQYFGEFGVMLSDSTADKLFPAAAAFFRRRYFDSDHHSVSENEYRISFAGEFNKKVSIGFTVDRLESTHSLFGKKIQHNADVGVHYIPIPELGLALVGYNILRPPSSVPDVVRLKREFGFGSYYSFSNFLGLHFDFLKSVESVHSSANSLAIAAGPKGSAASGYNSPVYNPSGWRWMFGLGSLFSEFWIARLGTVIDDIHSQRLVSVGFGFLGPRLTLDYSFENEVRTGGQYHAVDLRIVF